MNLDYTGQIFEKHSSSKFHEKPSSGSRVVPCGQTDGHDEATSLFFAILRTRLKGSCLTDRDTKCVDVQSCLMVAFRMPLSGVDPSASVILVSSKVQTY
jgi:hypothetical protein